MIFFEGRAKMDIPEIVLSKKSKVFYNPYMKINRDFTIIILKSFYDISGKKFEILDSMAATGIRSIRIFKEIPEVVKSLTIVDIRESSIDNIKENLKINEIEGDIEILREDCRKVMYSRHFDYIDIDPFGSPVGFIQPAVFSLRNGGLLGVTATDISALSGSRKEACFRKYGVISFKTDFYLEFGIRVLSKYVIEEALRFDVALVPVFSYYYRHHYRIFFRKTKRSREIRYLIDNLGFVYYCRNCGYKSDEDERCKICGNKMERIGPIYKGNLYDELTLKYFDANRKNFSLDKDENTIIERILGCDSKMNVWYYYDLGYIAKYLKIDRIPKMEKILEVNNACRTHFSNLGIKCYEYPNLKI